MGKLANLSSGQILVGDVQEILRKRYTENYRQAIFRKRALARIASLPLSRAVPPELASAAIATMSGRGVSLAHSFCR